MLSRLPLKRSDSRNEAVTSPVPEDWIHDIHVVLDEPARNEDVRLGTMDGNHAPEQVRLNSRAESTEEIRYDTRNQSAWSKVAPGREDDEDGSHKGKQTQIPSSGKSVPADGNVAATEGRDAFLVHLDHSFPGLTVRGHWRIERGDICLAFARKCQLVQGDVDDFGMIGAP